MLEKRSSSDARYSLEQAVLEATRKWMRDRRAAKLIQSSAVVPSSRAQQSTFSIVIEKRRLLTTLSSSLESKLNNKNQSSNHCESGPEEGKRESTEVIYSSAAVSAAAESREDSSEFSMRTAKTAKTAKSKLKVKKLATAQACVWSESEKMLFIRLVKKYGYYTENKRCFSHRRFPAKTAH